MTGTHPRLVGSLSWPVAGTLVLAVLRHPRLWSSALGALGRTAGPRWWRHRPFLPLPDPDWWAFRMVTAYGRPDAEPRAADVVSYLEWSRSTGAGGRTRRRDRGAPDGWDARAGRQSG